jgi:hypothetical protein
MAIHTPIRWLSVALMLAPAPAVFPQETQPASPPATSTSSAPTGFFAKPLILTSLLEPNAMHETNKGPMSCADQHVCVEYSRLNIASCG